MNEEERLRLIQRAEIELMGQKKIDISSTDKLPGAGTVQQYHELSHTVRIFRIFPSLGTFK